MRVGRCGREWERPRAEGRGWLLAVGWPRPFLRRAGFVVGGDDEVDRWLPLEAREVEEAESLDRGSSFVRLLDAWILMWDHEGGGILAALRSLLRMMIKVLSVPSR